MKILVAFIILYFAAVSVAGLHTLYALWPNIAVPGLWVGMLMSLFLLASMVLLWRGYRLWNVLLVIAFCFGLVQRVIALCESPDQCWYQVVGIIVLAIAIYFFWPSQWVRLVRRKLRERRSLKSCHQ